MPFDDKTHRLTSAPFTVMIEVDTLDRGGLENVVYDLATQFDHDLFRVVVVCVNSGGQVAKKLEEQDFIVEVLKDDKEKAFLVLLDRYQADVLFSHHSFLGAPLAHQLNIPVLSVLHNMYFWFEKDILSIFREQDPFVRRYVAVSSRVRDFIATRFKVDKQKITVIPNGIDVKKLEDYASDAHPTNRGDWGLSEEDIVFLNVAAITPVKNQNLILEVVNELRYEFPQLKVLIIGKSLSVPYEHFLKEKWRRYGLSNHIRFIEFTDRIYDLYGMADAFILPSFIEGWSLAAMEAACFHLPMLLTDVGSAHDLVNEGADITLVDLFPEGMKEVDNAQVLWLSENPRVQQVAALRDGMRAILGKLEKVSFPRQLDLIQARKFTTESMVRGHERELLRVIADAAKCADKQDGIDIRTRFEHMFREIWDVRQTITQLDQTSSQRRDLIQEISVKDREAFQQLLDLLKREFESAADERKQIYNHLHLVLNSISQLNAVVNAIVSRTEYQNQMLTQVGAQILGALQEVNQNILSASIVQRDILNRLSLTERLRAWKRKMFLHIKNEKQQRKELKSRSADEAPTPTGDPPGELNQPEEQPQVQDKLERAQAPIPEKKPGNMQISERGREGYAVLCFPIIDWEFRFQRPQQLLSRFADAGHTVYYATVLMDIALERYSLTPMRENVFQVKFSMPKSFNIYWDKLDVEATEYLVKSIQCLVDDRDLKEVVLIVHFPFWQPLAQALSQKHGWKVIYDCMDEHSGFSDVGQRFKKEEETLLRTSQLVVVSSHKLLEKATKYTTNVVRLMNGADFSHFYNPLPNNQVHLKHPILGYFGAIAEWFDFEAIMHAADQHRDWNFILIGAHHTEEVENLKKFSNILLGEIPYPELPGYLGHFDVCLIPMRISPLIEATNPVKFFEYLCTGKPIVAADLPELRAYSDIFYCYSVPEDLELKAEQALRETLPRVAQKRIDVARKNQWSARFRQLESHIDQLFPLVSIIIPSYNNLDYLKLCLESVRVNTIHPNLQVIVVDNASGPDTIVYLREMTKKWSQLSVVFNETNIGFARAVNQGAKLAEGDYMVLLNDDVVVTKGWLNGLMKYLQNPSVGMVGPVTNSCGNEACIEVAYQNLDDMESFARDLSHENKGRFFEIKVLAFFCTIIPRRVWELVGVLDEQYEVGLFEDDDYAIRVKDKGFKLLCAQDVFVHHFGRTSFSRMDDVKYNGLFNQNKDRFEKKWNKSWTPHKALQPTQNLII